MRKVDCSGKLGIKDRHWNISGALNCHTLVRELDLSSQRSTAVERWLESTDT